MPLDDFDLDSLAEQVGSTDDGFDLDSLADQVGGGLSVEEERKRLYANALPALGKVELGSNLSKMTKAMTNPFVMGALGPVGAGAGIIDKALSSTGLAPEGMIASQTTAALNSGLGWLPGLAERAGILPEGTRQDMNKAIEEERIGIASQLSPAAGAAFMTAQGLAEVSGGAIPGGVAAGTARAAGVATQLGTKGKAIARGFGVLAEGLTQAVGDTAGLEGGDQATGMALAGALSVLGAKVEASKFTAAENARLRKTHDPAVERFNTEAAAEAESAIEKLGQIGKIKESAIAEKASENQERLGNIVSALDNMTEQNRSDLRLVMQSEANEELAKLELAKLERRKKTNVTFRTEESARKYVEDQLGREIPPRADEPEPDIFIDTPMTNRAEQMKLRFDATKPDGTPYMINEKPVGFEETSENFKVVKESGAEAPHFGAYEEPWMKNLPVDHVDVDQFSTRMDETHAIAPMSVYVGLVKSGAAVNPERMKLVRPNGTELDILILTDKNTGEKFSFALRELEGGEARGEATLAGEGTPTLADKAPNPEEATKVTAGAMDAAEKVMDDSVSSVDIVERTRQAEIETRLFLWDIYGNPDKNPGQDYLDLLDLIKAQEEKLNTIRTRALEAKARLLMDIPEAMTVVESMSSIARLRQNARILAANTGDPRIFDAFDNEYRRKIVEPGFLEPEDMQTRTVEDALSQYQDAFYASTEKIRKRAMIAYKKHLEAKNQPLTGPDGSVLTMEDVAANEVYNRTFEFQGELRTFLQEATNSASTPEQLVREIDLRTKALLKKNRIKADQIGFRGDLAFSEHWIIDSGAEWISKNMPENIDLHAIPDEQLVSLAAKAKAEKAPLSVYNFLESEAQRRMKGIAPRKLATANPDDIAAAARKAYEVANDDIRAMIGASLKDPPKTWIGRAVNKTLVILKTQLANDLQLSHGRLPFLGHSIAEPLAQLADVKLRKQAIKVLRGVIPKAQSDRAIILHQMNTALADLDRASNVYMETLKGQGIKISRTELYNQMLTAYEAGDLSVLPPEISHAIKTTVQPRLNEISKLVDETNPDPEKRVAIKANMGRYVFRSYAIFQDPDAIFKPLDKSTEPYKNMYDAIKAHDYDAIKDAMYQKYSNTLREAGMKENEIGGFINNMVDQEIHGKIQGLVVENLSFPHDRKSHSPVIQKAVEDFLKDRQIDDPNLRMIMGAEKNFALAARITAEKVARDVAAFRIQKGLIDGYRKAGLVSDHRIPDIAYVALNSKTLKRISEGDPDFNGEILYANPKVAEQFAASQEFAGSLSYFSDRVVAMLKAGMVLSTGGLLANMWAVPQSLLTGVGFARGIKAMFTDSVIAAQLANEMAVPGSSGHMSGPVARRLYKHFGYMTPEQVSKDAEDLIRLGLDLGGELNMYFDEGTRALIDAYKGATGKHSTKLEKLNAAKELYRRPDVFAKVVVYKNILAEIMDKEMLDSVTDDVKKIAAQRALNLTQNPATTPAFVRNLSRGVTGLATFGFQGFFYQQARNLYYSGKYAYSDAIDSVKKGMQAQQAMQRGDVAGATKLMAQSRKYAKYSMDRATGLAIGGYLAYEVLSSIFGDEQDKEDAVKHALWADQRNGRYLVNSVERDKDGKIHAKVIQLGSTDYYDNSIRFFNILAGPGEPLQKLNMAKNELMMQLFQPSAMLEAGADFLGYQFDNKDLVKAAKSVRPRGSIGKERGIFGSTTPGKASITIEGTQKAFRRMAPTVVRNLWDVASIPFADPMDPVRNRQSYAALRASTGIRGQDLDMNKLYARRYNEDWASGQGWISGMKKEWKEARTTDARNAIVDKYQRNWDRTYAQLMETTGRAKELGFKPSDLTKMFNDDAYHVGIPSSVKSFLIREQRLSLKNYLSSLEN